ncbi:MAG: MotA/TolQ/ExbB proton channel family protein [Planctomycetota bacterium]
MKNFAHIPAALAFAALAFAAPAAVHAADDAPAPQAPAAAGFSDAATDIEKRLDDSLKELADLRRRMADEKIPLSRRLGDLEQDLVKARQELTQASRTLDNRTLDLGRLTNDIKAREQEAGYLANLLGEYLRNFEAGLHIAELQLYRDRLKEAQLASEKDEATAEELFKAQSPLIAMSLERLESALGGSRFAGQAVAEDGTVAKGSFVLLGPTAVFRSDDGARVGTAEQRLGSLEPAIFTFDKPELAASAGQFVAGTGGAFPFDPTLGTAHKIEATEETLWEHIKAGGPVMVPIFALAGAALLVALFKWVSMLFVRMPSRSRVKELMAAVGRGDQAKAAELAGRMKGPMGRMLRAGIEALRAGQPREEAEESMYETMQVTRLSLNRFLPFVAISAAAAPLLGLLGTVTGIMNTFNMITIYGTGDVKSLSSGISEALITTEYGLIVAIPSLLIHAFLSAKARNTVNRMETTGVAFMNEVLKSEVRAKSAPAREAVGAA